MPTPSRPASSRRPDSNDELTDEALLAGLRHGDPGAAGAFVRRYQRRVYGLARSIVGDVTQAEDIAQEALSRAWRHAEAYDPRRGSVSTWVLRITRNLAVDTLRRRAAEPVDPRAVIFLDQSAPDPAPDESASIAEQTRQVRAALHGLPAEQRRALILSAFYGYTARDISEADEIPLGTAKTRIRNGLAKVRLLLQQDALGRDQSPEDRCSIA